MSAAAAAPGVHSVITAADVPGLNAHGRTVPDQPVFCFDYVRFTGDPICLVLADSLEQAEAAAALVKVEYEVLRGHYSPRESLAEGAFPILETSPTNITKELTHEVGDIASAFAAADHVVEGHFTTQRQDHAFLEPLTSLAEVGPGGSIIIHTPQQAPFETPRAAHQDPRPAPGEDPDRGDAARRRVRRQARDRASRAWRRSPPTALAGR